MKTEVWVVDATGEETFHKDVCTARLKVNVKKQQTYVKDATGDYVHQPAVFFELPIKSYRLLAELAPADTYGFDSKALSMEVATEWCKALKEWGFYEVQPNEMWTMTAEEVNINRWFATFNLVRDMWEHPVRVQWWFEMCQQLPDADKWVLCILAHKTISGHALMYYTTSKRTDPQKVLASEPFQGITGFDWSKEISLSEAFGNVKLPYTSEFVDYNTGIWKEPMMNRCTEKNWKELYDGFMAQPV